MDIQKHVVKCYQVFVFKLLLQKQHITYSNILSTVFSLSIVQFFENSSSKASGLLFTFVYMLSIGHAHFPTNKIYIPSMPIRPRMLLLVVERLKSQLRKPGSKSVDSRYAKFLIGKRNWPSRQELTCT